MAPDADVSRFRRLLQRASALGVLAECQSLHGANLSQPVEACWGSKESAGSLWKHRPCACCPGTVEGSFSLCVCNHVQGLANGCARVAHRPSCHEEEEEEEALIAQRSPFGLCDVIELQHWPPIQQHIRVVLKLIDHLGVPAPLQEVDVAIPLCV